MSFKKYRSHFFIKWLCLIIFFLLFIPALARCQDSLHLWYEQPAQTWTEALPIGNGSLGAMIFGRVNHECIQLNEETVWTGHPIKRANPDARAYLDSVRQLLFDGKYVEGEKLAQQKMMGKRLDVGKHSYQTLGNMHIDLKSSSEVKHYQRSLDLSKALAEVRYQKQGVRYRREFFSSYPDQIMAMKLSADKPGSMTFQLKLDRPGQGEKVEVRDTSIIMRQQVGGSEGGVHYTARVKVLLDGGSMRSKDSTLYVKNANNVTILLAAETNYRGNNPDKITKKRIQKACSYSYSELRKRHVNDYQHLFKRVLLDLTPNGVQAMPTDRRLKKVKNDHVDPHITELYFQFGRYLLISSSRPGSLPANLQGLWAQGMAPPWNADYHTNINLQMNYWPAELTNLAETAHPLFDFVEALNKRGQKTARRMYGARGTVVHHTTDVWHFTAPIGQTHYGLWPMGAAWLSMRFWEHYRFIDNCQFLRKRAYPQMKMVCKFFADYLVKDPDSGYLVTGPSMSPENQFITPNGNKTSVTMGPTMDMEILHELFSATIKATNILHTDAAFMDTLQKLKWRLAPIQIGANGTIMEWNNDFKEADPGHRHISHLYSLFPGHAINAKRTPDLLKAAQKTIERRLNHGGGNTGWSRAWMINWFARLKNGNKAYQNLLTLLRTSTLTNLFDTIYPTRPLFQIDANFGATAGIAEMLLQSHLKTIDILPALPDAWSQGRVTGLKARGNFEIDITWKSHQLTQAIIKSLKGNKCIVRTNYPVRLQGRTISSKKTNKGYQITFPTKKQHFYTLIPE